jgi:predicted nucleic acid-binding protein
MIPNDLRANLNVFALSLNIKDVESISILGKKIGISYKQFKNLFIDLKNKVENRQYSYLVIDNTTNSPIPVSVNFFDKIIFIIFYLKKINFSILFMK